MYHFEKHPSENYIEVSTLDFLMIPSLRANAEPLAKRWSNLYGLFITHAELGERTDGLTLCKAAQPKRLDV